MRIYVIRHGQSEANLRNVHAGWAQVSLTEKGTAQAISVGERIRDLHFDQVIVSDLIRAQQTAQLALPGREYKTDMRIREISVGDLALRPVAECERELGETYLRNRARHDFTPYGGENPDQMQSRVSAFMDELTTEPEDAQIAVFCHEGVIYCMLCHVLGVRPAQMSAFADNCSISVFTYRNGYWILNKWNETGNVIPEN